MQVTFFGSAAVFALLLCASTGRAQTSRAHDAPPRCQKRAAADTGRVALADSSAPARWNKEILASVAKHEACVGMTADMLRKSWGLPTSIRTTLPATPGDTTSLFYYKGATVVLINDQVRAMRPAETMRMPRP